YASSRHARLFRRGSQWFVEDLESRNGTFVAGNRIDQPEQVGVNTDIKMGRSTVRLVASVMRKLKFAAASDRGLVRGNNEDSAYAGPYLLALADGMGGHAAGEVASKLMITHLMGLDKNPRDNDMLALLGTVSAEANWSIAEHIRKHPET